jgi:hypothetical protein
MNNQPWSPEDGELLLRLRTSAGIDAFIFARTNTLSVAQLQELESGEGQNFYSELIKRNAGIKLLKKLGYDYPVNEIQETLPASDAMIAAPAPAPAPAAATEADLMVKPVVSSVASKKPFPNPFVKYPLLMTGGLLSLVLWGFLGIQHLDTPTTETQRQAAPQIENAQPNGSAAARPSPILRPR